MKYAAWGVLIVFCFIMGRVMYLPLAPALVGGSKGAAAKSETRQVVIFRPGSRQVEVTLDITTVRDDEIPASVTLLERALVGADDGSNKTELAKDDTVRVVKRMGNNLLISAGGPLTGLVPISKTDFSRRVIEMRLGPMLNPAIAQNPTPAPATPAPGPGPMNPVPAPANPQPAPAPANPTPAPTNPTPTPATPVVVNDPDPPAPAPAPAGDVKLTEDQIVEIMKKSVAAGEIKEFTVDQVQGWKAGEEEDVDEETYQTGLAAYKAKTIFGEKVVQAKALIKGGKVAKWVYAKTGMEIR